MYFFGGLKEKNAIVTQSSTCIINQLNQMSYEPYLPRIPRIRNHKKIRWTPEMIEQVKKEFPVSYNRALAKELNVSMRSLIRKARELGIQKEKDFLIKRKNEIQEMSREAHPPHPYKGVKGWHVPNSKATRFKPGNISAMKTNPDVVQKVRKKRNETIARDRRRIRLGLSPLSNLKLKS